MSGEVSCARCKDMKVYFIVIMILASYCKCACVSVCLTCIVCCIVIVVQLAIQLVILCFYNVCCIILLVSQCGEWLQTNTIIVNQIKSNQRLEVPLCNLLFSIIQRIHLKNFLSKSSLPGPLFDSDQNLCYTHLQLGECIAVYNLY